MSKKKKSGIYTGPTIIGKKPPEIMCDTHGNVTADHITVKNVGFSLDGTYCTLCILEHLKEAGALRECR